MELPDEVRAACETWLAAIELRAPALVTGLHLRGGLGFGEYVAGKSDIDFVATLSRRPLAADLDDLELALGAVTSRHPGLAFDGAHLLAADLAPPSVPATPHHPIMLVDETVRVIGSTCSNRSTALFVGCSGRMGTWSATSSSGLG